MRINISVNRPFHALLMADVLNRMQHDVSIYSSAPRRYFPGLDQRVHTRFVLAPFLAASYKLHFPVPAPIDRFDTWLFDRTVALNLRPAEVFIGWASQALHSAEASVRHGSRFVLDRACPHRDFQDTIISREAERTGAKRPNLAPWYRDRQLREYELAEKILVPSDYTMRSFPPHLRPKLLKAPLLGRCRFPDSVSSTRNKTFTVGVVGGNPLRKGYLYLLQAWQKLALPNARLLIRSGDFTLYPVLESLMKTLPNVEQVGYFSDISDFYQQCDVFVLPSVDDGFGMALVEAMTNQRACIATTHCGASEIITTGKDGIVVPPADTDALAGAILELYENDDLRQSIAAEGRRRAREYAASMAYETAMEELISYLVSNG